MRRKWLTTGLVVCGAAGLIPACGESTTNPEGEDFLADNPMGGGGDEGAGETGAAGTDGGDSDEGSGDPGGDGEREISEADIVQIEGDRLYALSRYNGLSVIDVSNPQAMRVLGRYETDAEPFEMYVDNGQVFMMLSEFASYEWDEDLAGYSWHSASRLIAVDAADPTDIELRGEFEMPGRIQDSRRVGDILYLVTFEDGYCWGCQERPNLTVTSLDIANPATPNEVDRLTLEAPDDEEWWWGSRSVATTNERMYVGGGEYADGGDWRDAHSRIEVIDISNPNGAIARGTTLDVAGTIQNRWQMDEHEGVLRVISQPGWWGNGTPPIVETFTVESAQSVTPSGQTELVLPRPESLRSVRFDAERGYAITFEQTDPLFTIDLSDPSTPQQMGELEIPGWVHHMEPRGDTIVGLGFDPDHPDGSINVSLFDVSDFANPTMTDRVHFGGDWAYFPEDQNRIHKAFTLLDERNLILVPFSGWEDDEGDGCWGTHQSGIQLIDWNEEDLTARGVAQSRGQSRRALIHRDQLIGVSDNHVESFDISDRDQPTRFDTVELATNVSQVGIDGSLVVRMAHDWWSNEAVLQTASIVNPDSAEPLGELRLNTMVGDDPEACEDAGYWGAEIYVRDDYAYLVRNVYSYDEGEDWAPTTRIDIIDLNDPTAPAYVDTIDFPFSENYGYGDLGLGITERNTTMVGDALVSVESRVDWDGNRTSSQSAFQVIDLSDPTAPALAERISRPNAMSHGGLQVFGDRIVSWHMVAADGDGSKVRFYLDQLDVSNPASPTLATPVNVPGVVVSYDAATRRAVTADFQIEQANPPQETCWEHPRSYYNYATDSCMIARRDLNLVQIREDGRASRLQTIALEDDEHRLTGVGASQSRLFAQLRGGNDWYGYSEDGGGVYRPDISVAVFADPAGESLEVSAMVDLSEHGLSWGRLQAVGTRLLFPQYGAVGELDATDAASPQIEVHKVRGWGCQSLETTSDHAYCASGTFGLQMIPL